MSHPWHQVPLKLHFLLGHCSELGLLLHGSSLILILLGFFFPGRIPSKAFPSSLPCQDTNQLFNWKKYRKHIQIQEKPLPSNNPAAIQRQGNAKPDNLLGRLENGKIQGEPPSDFSNKLFSHSTKSTSTCMEPFTGLVFAFHL